MKVQKFSQEMWVLPLPVRRRLTITHSTETIKQNYTKCFFKSLRQSKKNQKMIS